MTPPVWLRHPLYTGVLAVAWMVLQERFGVGEFVIGYVLGAAVCWACRDFWAERVRVRRPATILRLLATFAKEVVVANVQVAWLIVQPRLPIRPAFVVVPLDLRDDLAITMLGNMITLTPGTLTLDVAADRSALYVHCLAASDADAVRAQIKRQFEAPLQRGLECSPL